MFRLVSILRHADVLLSSRFHAIVTTLPAAGARGRCDDGRAHRKPAERRPATRSLLLRVDDPDLEAELAGRLENWPTQGERIADGIARTVVKNLKVMARMGVLFEEEVQRRYPEFPRARGNGVGRTTLPPMNGSLRQLVAAYS